MSLCPHAYSRPPGSIFPSRLLGASSQSLLASIGILIVKANLTRSIRGRYRGPTNSAGKLPEYRTLLSRIITCYFRFLAEASVGFLYQSAGATQPCGQRSAERYVCRDVDQIRRFLCQGTSHDIKPKPNIFSVCPYKGPLA